MKSLLVEATVDEDLSLRAKGLLHIIVGFNFSTLKEVYEYTEPTPDTKLAVRKTLTELERAGYLKLENRRVGGQYRGMVIGVRDE